MNFDFSDELKMLREQARKFLAGRCSRQVVRKVFEGGAGYDAELWAEIARMGWLGTAVPEAYGGSGVGYDGLCVACRGTRLRARAGAVLLLHLSRRRGNHDCR